MVMFVFLLAVKEDQFSVFVGSISMGLITIVQATSCKNCIEEHHSIEANLQINNLHVVFYFVEDYGI